MSSRSFKIPPFLRGDRVIWTIFFTLCAISLVEVFSAGSYLALKSGNYMSPLFNHFALLCLATIAAWLFHHMRIYYFRILALVAPLPMLIMLVATMFLGQNINNGTRWISILGLSIQPSEIAKIVLVLLVSLILSFAQTPNGQTRRVAFFTVTASLFLIVPIALQNLSTAVIMMFVVTMMLIIARVPWRNILKCYTYYFLPIGLLFLSIITFVPKDVLESNTVTQRFTTWQSRIKRAPEAPMTAEEFIVNDKNRQEVHARIAFARSGVKGLGPGRSVQRDYLAAAYSDFIFAIIGEEFGIGGCIFVVLLYIILFFRAGHIAKRCNTAFPAFIVMGLALMLVTQALVNMAVAVGLFPVTGQTLPLISKGGSSSIITGCYFGIILAVSNRATLSKKAKEEDALATADE